MKEKFEITICNYNAEYDDEENAFTKASEDIRSAFSDISQNIDIEEIDVGAGASVAGLVITLWTVIIIGKEINEILDNWAELINKFAKIIKKLNKKYEYVFIDKNSAILIAIDYLIRNIATAKYIEKRTIKKIDIDQKGLLRIPVGIYLISFIVDSTTIITVGVSYNGNIKYVDRLEINCI